MDLLLNPTEKLLQERLHKRKQAGLFRKLPQQNTLVDFCSNDYLGLSRSEELKLKLDIAQTAYSNFSLGSTGSRLLSGNTEFAEQLEQYLATFHGVEAALIFNSGYAANLGLFSCLPQKGDTVIMDELMHCSAIDGCRIGFGKRIKFKHNDISSLEAKLKNTSGVCYVAIESVYSMNGNLAPLTAIHDLCKKYGALLIIDEAHAFGVFGKGLVHLAGLTTEVLATVITFGKALGAHGAVILGSNLLRDYLINFARPFIYSTAIPFFNLLHIKIAYEYLQKHEELQYQLQNKIQLFHNYMFSDAKNENIKSPIKAVIIPGNEQVTKASHQLAELGIAIFPILSPTVPRGSERLRICLHTHNSESEIKELSQFLLQLPTTNTNLFHKKSR